MRILIIEDDAKTADFVVRGFQKAGFQTCHCADGSAGLDKAKSEPFDAAVIDIMLPKMDGFTVIDKALKKAETTISPNRSPSPNSLRAFRHCCAAPVRSLNRACSPWKT